jgi:hypothetical protein
LGGADVFWLVAAAESRRKFDEGDPESLMERELLLALGCFSVVFASSGTGDGSGL